MKPVLTRLRWPVRVGLVLVLPFLVLELANRRSYGEGFPFLLFGLLWLLPTAFIFVLGPFLQQISYGATASVICLVLEGALLLLIAGAWIGIVLDQMPCFLGVRFCD